MARTYPLTLNYGTCLGHAEDPYSFSSLYLEDLHNGQRTYIRHLEQLTNAIPKSLDPTSRFALRAHVTPPGHQRLCFSIRAALWWLLPSDRDFRRAPNGLHYYLARQGRRVILRGGNVTVPLPEVRLNWIPDSPSNVTRRNSSDNSSSSVPRNILVPVPSASRNNPRESVPSVPHPENSVQRVPKRKENENKMSASATRSPPAVPLSPAPPKKCRIRRRRQAQRAANRNSRIISAAPLTQDERWANQSTAGIAGATHTQPENSDPTSTMRTAVYPPSRIVGDSPTNENSPFQIGLESSRIPGLYKPASSPPYLLPCTKPFSGRPAGSQMTSPTREAGEALRFGSGIVYPLLPRAHRPDTRVTVDAALPEPVAFQRQRQPPTVVEIGSPVQSQASPVQRRHASRKTSRKRRRNRSTAIFRPAKRSPPRGHWCD